MTNFVRLLQYQSTPSCKDGLSPAQKLFGLAVQDILPVHHCSFLQEWQHKTQEAKEQAEHTLQISKTYYNVHTCSPSSRHPHWFCVAIQNPLTKLQDIYGIVTDISPHCQFYVKTNSGRIGYNSKPLFFTLLCSCIHPYGLPVIRPTYYTHSEPPSTLWCSIHTRQPTKWLIEDPNWIWTLI